jgi:hypothetical protein
MDYKKKYFKYKEKYVKLKQLGGTNNSNIPKDFTDEKYNTNIKIKIDDIYFMIICKSRDPDGRELFLLKSSLTNNFKEYKIIKFYRSLSELHFLRLGTMNDNVYYKGKYHYVQQTFIDIRLQKFINKNISKIPCIDFDIDENYRIENHIDDKKRIEDTTLFNYSDTCGIPINYLEVLKIMKNISNNLFRNFNFNNNRLIYKYEINDEKTQFSYNIYSLNLKRLSETIKPNWILLYMIIDFCKYDNSSFIIKAFDNNISPFQNLDTGKECKYTQFFIPVFLTTENSKITEYGTYNKYVVGTNYICKFLDYKKQCSYLEKFSNTCYLENKYSIIADRYVDVYPFNELADTNLIKIIKEGNLTKENIEENLAKENIEENIKDNISSINIPNSNTGMTPLIYAIIYKKYSTDNNIYNKYFIKHQSQSIWKIYSKDAIELIINEGADINYHNIYNHRSVLLYTIEDTRFDITDLLFIKGANINYTDDGKYMSQIMIAIIFCDFNKTQVDKLFDLKPDNIDYVYNDKSALELAIYYSKLSFIGGLVNAGANTNNNTGKSLIFDILELFINIFNIYDNIAVQIIKNTIKILNEKNEENIAKSLFRLLITNQKKNANIIEIIKIIFEFIEDKISYFFTYHESINIFHLYKLNTIHNFENDDIKRIYHDCNVKNKSLINVVVKNYDDYNKFIVWINENKLFVNKIVIKENKTNKELLRPNQIEDFIINENNSLSIESPVNNNDLYKPLSYLNFYNVDDIIEI